jgi:hypothetical protein
MRDRQKQCVFYLHVFKTEISFRGATLTVPLVVAFIHYMSKLGGNLF